MAAVYFAAQPDGISHPSVTDYVLERSTDELETSVGSAVRLVTNQMRPPGKPAANMQSPKQIESATLCSGGTPMMCSAMIMALSRTPHPAKEIGNIVSSMRGGTMASR